MSRRLVCCVSTSGQYNLGCLAPEGACAVSLTATILALEAMTIPQAGLSDSQINHCIDGVMSKQIRAAVAAELPGITALDV
jgi:hypothetical protein